MTGSKYSSKDATGKQIEIGKMYGYSINRNGITHVKIGTALKLTSKGLLTINVLISEKAYNYSELSPEKIEKNISVKPNLVFPVDPCKI